MLMVKNGTDVYGGSDTELGQDEEREELEPLAMIYATQEKST